MNLPHDIAGRRAAYLERIGYTGSLEPDLATLRGLHRAHLLAIPYENLDLHQGRSLALDEEGFFTKLVGLRRGGWCYEMNGLFAWALRTLGFTVHLLSSTVGRGGPFVVEGDHLVLLVELDQLYLADVGFGNGFLEPLPLAEGEYKQGFLRYTLRHEASRWIFQSHQYSGQTYDFTLESRTLADFAGACATLQTDPQSGFVRMTVCHRFTPDTIISLRGAMLQTITAEGVAERTIATAAEYDQLLREGFDLHFEDSHKLWEYVWRRHCDWQAALAAQVT